MFYFFGFLLCLVVVRILFFDIVASFGEVDLAVGADFLADAGASARLLLMQVLLLMAHFFDCFAADIAYELVSVMQTQKHPNPKSSPKPIFKCPVPANMEILTKMILE